MAEPRRSVAQEKKGQGDKKRKELGLWWPIKRSSNEEDHPGLGGVRFMDIAQHMSSWSMILKWWRSTTLGLASSVRPAQVGVSIGLRLRFVHLLSDNKWNSGPIYSPQQNRKTCFGKDWWSVKDRDRLPISISILSSALMRRASASCGYGDCGVDGLCGSKWRWMDGWSDCSSPSCLGLNRSQVDRSFQFK